MAIFNPAPPDVNPPSEFLGPHFTGHAVSQSEPFRPGKSALDFVGQGIEGGANVLDLSIKRGLRDTIYKDVDQQRDQFTDALQKINSQVDTGVIPAPVQSNNGPTTGSVLDNQPQNNIPAGVANGVAKIKQLQLAANNGSARINDTMYAAQTLSIAKRLRAQYPGQREFIDQEVSKASGLPVANAYYQNLMQDINQKLTQLGRRRDDVGHMMMSNMDVPNMDKYLVMRANGDKNYPGDAYVLHQINSWKNLQSTIKIDSARRADAKFDQEDIKTHDTQSVTKGLNDMVYHFIDDNLQLSGTPDLRSLLNYMSDYQAGRVTGPDNSDAVFQQRAQQLQVYRNYIFQHAQKFASSYSPTVGEDQVQKIISSAMTPIDTYIKLADDKNAGPSVFHFRQVAAMKADDQYNWLVSKDKGQISRQLLTARGILGQQAFPQFVQNVLSDGADKAFSDLFHQEAMSSVAPFTDERGNPIPRYLNDAIQHAKAVSTPSHPIPPEYYGSIVNWVNTVADPNLPEAAKDRIIDWAFNPKNIGVLDNLKMEYKDPNTGVWVPGKYRAFNIMTSPKITQSIALTARDHPQNWIEYQNWVESSFGSLFRSDLQTLNGALKSAPKGIHVAYNDVSHTFSIVDVDGRDISNQPKYMGMANRENPWARVALEALDRLDGKDTGGGIRNLNTMMMYNPHGEGDTEQYLLGLVQTVLHDDPNNFVAMMMGKALVQTRNPDMSPDEINEKFLKQ